MAAAAPITQSTISAAHIMRLALSLVTRIERPTVAICLCLRRFGWHAARHWQGESRNDQPNKPWKPCEWNQEQELWKKWQVQPAQFTGGCQKQAENHDPFRQ